MQERIRALGGGGSSGGGGLTGDLMAHLDVKDLSP